MSDHELIWDCDLHGCFNKKARLKFKRITPYPISGGTDLDFVTELRRNFLAIEWKEKPYRLRDGQRIFFEHLSELPAFTVIRVAGDAEEMRPDRFQVCKNGEWLPWEDTTPDGFYDRLARWGRYALANPRQRL